MSAFYPLPRARRGNGLCGWLGIRRWDWVACPCSSRECSFSIVSPQVEAFVALPCAVLTYRQRIAPDCTQALGTDEDIGQRGRQVVLECTSRLAAQASRPAKLDSDYSCAVDFPHQFFALPCSSRACCANSPRSQVAIGQRNRRCSHELNRAIHRWPVVVLTVMYNNTMK